MPEEGRSPHEPHRIDPYDRRSGSMCHRRHHLAESADDQRFIGDAAGHGQPGVRESSATGSPVGTAVLLRRTARCDEARVEAEGEVDSEGDDRLTRGGSCQRHRCSLPSRRPHRQ